jgi:hypothetical protein
MINALKKIWQAATVANRWMAIESALDLIYKAYEAKEGVPATAFLTPKGIFIEIELDELVVGLLEPEDIKKLSPKAYDMLRKARAFEVADVTLTRYKPANPSN